MSSDRDIGELLGALGFSGAAAQAAARSLLDSEGLTNPRKSRVSEPKIPRIESLLAERLGRACADPACEEAVRRSGRQVVRVSDRLGCERCGGSDNRRAMARFADACRARGLTKVVIVGGSPAVHGELTALAAPGLQLRLIEGTERRTQDRARADLEWAELVLVWGGTELDHKVSQMYTEPRATRSKLVLVARRGISALLSAGAERLERGS